MEVEVGEIIIVHERRHPYYNCRAEVIGRRGPRSAVPGDIWLWVFLLDWPKKPCMIPASMVRKWERDEVETETEV
ncbi:MAG: hypothetical protein H5T98_11485 [Syntrophomonadaceae bacterium]|nr:hypothetical protein [Syntrophomonadaceae bacterium]